MEAIWVAAEMRAGGAFAHSLLAIEVMNEVGQSPASPYSGRALAMLALSWPMFVIAGVGALVQRAGPRRPRR